VKNVRVHLDCGATGVPARPVVVLLLLGLSILNPRLSLPAFAQASSPAAAAPAIHRAARTGDIALLRLQLQQGTSPNARDRDGRTPFMDAASAGQLEAMHVLISAGAEVNAQSKAGRTPLIDAAAEGQLEAVRLLIESRADLNHNQRGWGTALETAERTGHNDIAALLRKAGAQSSGRSLGDTVCVRPWGGDGYCGVVKEVNKTAFTIAVTQLVGCKDGCPAKGECSAGRTVGGSDGIAVGDEVKTVSWCLTHTGVKP
jgi:hypothetical protein